MSINLDGLKEGASKLTVPAKHFGDLMIGTAEKFVAFQMDSCRAYSDIAFREMKKVPEVKSIEQAGDLLWGQIEPLSEINKQLLNDWKSLVALNSEFTQEMKSVFSTPGASTPGASQQASQAEKPAKTNTASKSKSTTRAAKAVASVD